jgi:hypothetical protein
MSYLLRVEHTDLAFLSLLFLFHTFLFISCSYFIILHVEGTQIAAAFNRNTSEAASVATTSVSNTDTVYIPTAIINNTVAASVDAVSVPTTASTSVPNTVAVSIPSAYHTATSLPTAYHTVASIPTTEAAFVPTAAAASLHTTASVPKAVSASVPNARPVKPSEFALDPVQAREFFGASEDNSLSLTDFLQKMNLTGFRL